MVDLGLVEIRDCNSSNTSAEWYRHGTTWPCASIAVCHDETGLRGVTARLTYYELLSSWESNTMKCMPCLSLVFVIVSTVQGANWPQWRGPNFNGSTEEKNLPSSWSRTENISWSADLPGASASTPIVGEDRVFVSSTDPTADVLKALCFDRRSGQLLWQHDVVEGIRKDERSYFATPSPVTDGTRVVFFYGNGALVAYDLSGTEIWSRNIQLELGEFAFNWTFSSSPVLFDGKLFLQVLQRDVAVQGRGFTDRKNESYLLAMNPATGETLWREIRPSKARAESRESFATPVPFEFQGRKELLVTGGDDVTGHDLVTGQELWRWGTSNPDRIIFLTENSWFNFSTTKY